jgi:hypothetical protein
LDTIEQRLTTDVTLAQAVVDLSEVARFVPLDGGRPINLLRVGMVVDALSRYLIDGGAMIYAVAGRELLSEASLTSKERMVLGRWADDGLIEVTPVVGDRVAEIADFTGVPLIAVRDPIQFAERFEWLRDSPERILRLLPRAGGAVLIPGGETVKADGSIPAVVVGKATARQQAPAELVETVEPESPVEAADLAEVADVVEEPESVAIVVGPNETRASVEAFTARGAEKYTVTHVVKLRFTRAEPSSIGVSLMVREWRCPEPDCPAFGKFRRIGQPVPRMRAGVPACPRHGQALNDVGPRSAAFPIAIVVDDLARHRFLVTPERPVIVGRKPSDPDDISVGAWLHEAAAAWIADEHLRLEVRDRTLVVTDTSENGTLIWKRSGPDDTGETTRVYGSEYAMGEWDSIELYTGVELIHGEHRLTTTVGDQPLSVLVDAPTVALLLPNFAKE